MMLLEEVNVIMFSALCPSEVNVFCVVFYVVVTVRCVTSLYNVNLYFLCVLCS